MNTYDSFLILLYPHLYINIEDSVYSGQFNLMNMDILFQYMPCHKTNMTVTGVDLPECVTWFC